MGNSESAQILNDIQTKIGHRFQKIELLQQALTHDSLRAGNPNLPTYQRMEFLGDSVIGFIITNYLFLKYPEADEHRLSSQRSDLVGRSKQQQIAESLGLQKYIQVDASVRGQHSFAAFNRYDKFIESVIGAVYLDAGGAAHGLLAAKNVIYRLWVLQEPSTSACIIA